MKRRYPRATHRFPSSYYDRPGVKTSWPLLAAWLAVPVGTVILLWLAVYFILQAACYEGSVRV